ncbi:hypothetical protein Ctob_015473 [Chrysochromulina tobinii]|uniref:Uncharacterized protein n=1 Tax=Chrysochromulina tobinii TaxID=1460289 RepID=A0A0M0K6I2_9EUKA|nr:hypothetical protein Ctob_015473 [Chrysochromulina tobinii]|eukprot:KOO34222.1 hypothetical protein Ctob_015473 [Chrysochromulina sp. CCMP291]
MSSSSSHAARPDIDFFLTTADSAEGLRVVRATLIALARYCEEHQIGMCVVRSPYAITVAMDDCDYDLQIVLCAFDSMEDVLSNFDIDACRIAYDGTRLLVSETFLRALVSGIVIARPQNESANHAKRLHKYATELGYSIAISDHDPAKPGKTFKQLKALEDAGVVPHAHPPPPQPQIQIVREWEASFVTTPQDIQNVSVVFQQLDMHPVRGAWNGKQKAFLADATSSMPLVFLDFIEDAALVVPKGFREKLPRRLHVPMRDEAGSVMFSRPPAGDAHWAA